MPKYNTPLKISSSGAAASLVERLRVNTPTTPDVLAAVHVAPNAATTKPLVIQGVASQAADLTQWQSSTGTVLASMGPAGDLSARRIGANATTDLALVNAAGMHPSTATSLLTGVSATYTIPATATAGVTSGVQVLLSTAAAAFTVPFVYQFYARSPTVGAGSAITSLFGMRVAGMTAATTLNVGVGIAAAGTHTLWLGYTADDTTANAGIRFGLSADTNLYRSAASTLKTDGNLVVGGTLTGTVANTPAGNIAATTVQAALNELDTEKAPIDAPNFTTSLQTPIISINTTTPPTGRMLNISGTLPDLGAIAINAAITGTFASTATTQATGMQIAIARADAAGTLALAVGLGVSSATKGAAGTITDLYGVRVRAQTVGTSSYGIAVAAAGTQTMWVGSEADSTTAAAGIGFGLSRDTTLYRSAASTLRTDGNFVVGNVAATERPSVGADLTTNGTFTGSATGWTLNTGWTYSANTVVHTPGNTGTLTQALTGMVAGGIYLVTLVMTGYTAGNVSVSLGGDPTAGLGGATSSSGVRAATSTPTLTVTPLSTFDGAIDSITLQLLTPAVPQLQFNSSAGALQGGVLADLSNGNYSLGAAVNLYAQSSGNNNNSTAMGNFALSSFVGGTNNGIGNTAFGSSTLKNLIWGNYNTAVGYGALQTMTGGSGNVAVGDFALYSDTTGASNVAVGTNALFAVTTGSNNVAAGLQVGQFITTGSNNVCLGLWAGVGGGGTSTNALTTGSSNVFIGINSRLGGTTQRSNAIAIGNAARIDGDSAIAIGVNASAGAAGAIAFGNDSTNAGATTTTANEIMFGTSNHTYVFPGTTMGFPHSSGTKFGTSITQKMAWWNATPVVQSTGWSATAGYIASKSFDPETATVIQANRVLGTLLDILKTYGILGA